MVEISKNERGVAREGAEAAGMPEISEMDDYDALVALFIRNELEFSVDDEIPTDIIKCWKAVAARADAGGERGARNEGEDKARPGGGGAASDKGEGRLVGGCVLALREGAFIIDGIAAEPEYRAQKLGSKLLGLALGEAKARGGREMFLVARAPGFFRKHGFVTVPRDGAPTFFECFGCPQYNVSCFPEVMRLAL
ncbi:MAG: GNAT family N-acetyltransferase [Clostridiales Family XIII bacterium]|jgi:ribosomal protein S18 acetylase RimI-like enzyme|nr:GNAT family N-acetyltransferase [Clostridiales Family XIII bacterium]